MFVPFVMIKLLSILVGCSVAAVCSLFAMVSIA